MKTQNGSDIPEGTYSNYFKIGHNADVFVIDHFQVFLEETETEPAEGGPHCPRGRIIISPSDAKALMAQLKSAIETYETTYGPIQNL
jgi:hypothetical protein